jgi:hypothetical protein
MPIAAKYDIHVRQGNTLQRTFIFQAEDGSPIDLSGSVIAFRAETGDGPVIDKTTNTAGFAMPDPVTGAVTLTLSPNETAQFRTGRFNRYEIERRIAGNETTLLTGFITAIQGTNVNE